MIPNVVKGADMPGLVRYLTGRGRENEHTNPHVIGGDGILQSLYGADELGPKDAARIAAYLDEPRRVFGTEIRTQVREQDPETGARKATGTWREQHVWHCSLSLPPGEVLSEQQWEQVSRELMDGMGFTAESGHAPARWVAIHHGASKGGNDHIHIAASMVREDGTRWEGRFRDWPTSQRVCREVEQRHGLTVVQGPELGTASRGTRRVEARKQDAAPGRSTSAVLPREDLASRVRSAAVASTSEAEWVRRLRGSGVVLKPRFAEGSTDVVVGYRAALKGQGRLDFYGGGQLGRDLTLPRLREAWPQPSLEQAGEASAEWQAAFRSRPPVKPGREAAPIPGGAPEAARRNLARFADRLAQTPAADRQAWSRAARDLSGAFSAMATANPAHAPALRNAATVIARAAQDRRAGRGHRPTPEAGGAALVLLAASRGKDAPQVAMAALMAQLLQAAAAVRDYHRQTQNRREALAVDHELQRLQAISLPGQPATRRDVYRPVAAAKRPPQKQGPDLQVPGPLEPGRPTVGPAVTNRKGREHDGGR